MAHRIAGIDVHKRILAVVVADTAVEAEYCFERRMVGTTPEQLRGLAAWLVECAVGEVVMASTAQYWRPVWEALERHWQPIRRSREGASPLAGALHLAQAQSNQGPRGRKKDFPDAERRPVPAAALVRHELRGPSLLVLRRNDALLRPERHSPAVRGHQPDDTANGFVREPAEPDVFARWPLGGVRRIAGCDGVTYEERGPAVTKPRALRRAAKMIRELRRLGYRVESAPALSTNPA